MAEFEVPEPNSTLGDRLLAGVRNLWKRVQALEADNRNTKKVVDNTALEFEELKRQVAALRRDVHGAKVARGRARAKSARLEQQLAEAERLLSESEMRLH
jgi:chromosome segregation ATPase